MLRPYISELAPDSVSFPPSRIIPNVLSNTIEVGAAANDLIEIVPLPDPIRSNAADRMDAGSDR